jgi:hypothetical protein
MSDAAQFWNARLAPEISGRDAYPVVEAAVKALLTQNPKYKGLELTTNELVEALYPEAETQGAGIAARQRLYRALEALEDRGLKNWHYRGPPRMWRGKMVRPRIWHVERKPICPNCGIELAA